MTASGSPSGTATTTMVTAMMKKLRISYMKEKLNRVCPVMILSTIKWIVIDTKVRRAAFIKYIR